MSSLAARDLSRAGGRIGARLDPSQLIVRGRKLPRVHSLGGPLFVHGPGSRMTERSAKPSLADASAQSRTGALASAG